MTFFSRPVSGSRSFAVGYASGLLVFSSGECSALARWDSSGDLATLRTELQLRSIALGVVTVFVVFH